MYLTRNLVLCSALLLAMSVLAPAADNTRGAVEQSGGNVVPQNPSPSQLHLNDAQREQIRETLLTKHTEIEFRLKATQAAKKFQPENWRQTADRRQAGWHSVRVDPADSGTCRLRLCETERSNSFGQCDDRRNRRNDSGNAATNDGKEITFPK